MPQFAFPTQYRYNDPYHQRITDYGSTLKPKYISRMSNDITKMFGDNILLKGLAATPTFLGSTISIALTAGILIHDSTLIQTTTTNTIDCDVSGVGYTDTPTTGSRLAVFTNFQYIEPPGAVSGGTGTFASSDSVVCSNSTVYNAIPTGSKIYNSTNDTSAYAVEVIAKTITGGPTYTLQLASAYAGTTGAGKTISGELNTQTEMKLSVYHVTSAGVPTAFGADPAFDATKNKLLLTILDFTKSGANVTAVLETPVSLSMVGPVPYITVSGTTYYKGGFTESNVSMWDFIQTLYANFIHEFIFHDQTRL